MQKTSIKMYKNRHEWVEKVIQWALCKGLKFDHTTECHELKPKSVPENETHKFR